MIPLNMPVELKKMGFEKKERLGMMGLSTPHHT
jgi:hypothetical protein